MVAILLSLLTLFISCSDRSGDHSLSDGIVDRAAVADAISAHSAVIIDARPEFQYELGHLPQAINIPYNATYLIELIEQYSLRNNHLIIYCSSSKCDAAESLLEKLRALGCAKMSIYAGGWEDWTRGR